MDQVAFSPMQLAPALEEGMNMIRAVLPSTIELNLEIEEGIPSVMMNSVQLQQVLLNLCVNARDAMEGQGELGICLSWIKVDSITSTASDRWHKNEWVELSIADTGCGIAADIIDDIFTPFFTTKEVGKGTGMGLSFVYGIMEKNGNHIVVESESGKGTTFRLLFAPVTQKITKIKNYEQRKPLLPVGHGENILVVDDEKNITNLISDILATYGYQPVVAKDGAEALAVFTVNPDRFSMLITDQTMPNLTGVQLIEALREMKPNLPVIICTGYSEKINAEEARNMGVEYFSKPVNYRDLIKKIAVIIH
jgi:CheY-like chemotaxis protein